VRLFAPPAAYRHLTAGRYLTALRQLRAEYKSREQTPLAASLLLWTLNAVDPWNRAWVFSGPGPPPPAGAILSEPESILAAAFSISPVVILMEAHRAPETRYFGSTLLPLLRRAGATHLAYETAFQRPLTAFEQSGVVRPDSEVYAFEPSRAALLRTARSLDLKLIAFDFPPEGHLRAQLARLRGRRSRDPEGINREREDYMAENIFRLILGPNPQARVVVWTGEQHALRKTPPEFPWQHPFMAAHLAALLGTDPVCIYQMCVDWPDLAGSPAALDQSHPWAQERGVDAIILHHRGVSPACPPWLEASRKAVEVTARQAELIQALPAAEGSAAVPVTQQLTGGKGDKEVSFLLPEGAFLLRGLRGSDELIWEETAAV
jgi:hypothetical protein